MKIGYYYLEATNELYMKSKDGWWKHSDCVGFLPYSISFDHLVKSKHLVFIGKLI
jgi:hypothetical protein